jgi:hypothetical protein
MRHENLPFLDGYVQEYRGFDTSRILTEDRFTCPPLETVATAEKAMFATLHTVYDGMPPMVEGVSDTTDYDDDSSAALARDYWEDAQHVGAEHGTFPDFELADYFRVSRTRSHAAISASVMERYPADGPIVGLFDAVNAYQDEIGIEGTESARFLTTLFSVSIPRMAAQASCYVEAGFSPAAAGDQAILDFIEAMVPVHIEDLKARVERGESLSAVINKPAQYPGYESESDSQTGLRISAETARGITSVYHLQERPYSDAELEVAGVLMQDPAMQKAILLFHNSMVDFAREYLGKHPDRAQHTLAPFNELFVAKPDQTGEMRLLPNPKLIKIIGNNAMPAVARILLEEGIAPQQVTGDHVRRGMEMAKKLRVFQAQIGEYNGYDEATDTVSLDSLFNSTCPAMQMFTKALRDDLSAMYETCRQAA